MYMGIKVERPSGATHLCLTLTQGSVLRKRTPLWATTVLALPGGLVEDSFSNYGCSTSLKSGRHLDPSPKGIYFLIPGNSFHLPRNHG